MTSTSSTTKNTTQNTTKNATMDTVQTEPDDGKRAARAFLRKVSNDHPMAWRITLSTHAFAFLGVVATTRNYAFATPRGKFGLPAMRLAANRAAATTGLPETCPFACDVHETRALWHMARSLIEEINSGRFAPDVLAGDDGHAIRTGHEWLAVEAACAYARRPAETEGDVFFKVWHRRDWSRETLLRHGPEIAALLDQHIETDIARLNLNRAAFDAKCVRAFAIIDRPGP